MKLTEVIPPQNFELVRDRIAAILLVELEAQVYMGSDVPAADIYVERTVPFSYTECPALNVSFAGGNFSNKDVKAADGAYLYNIDCYTASKTIGDNPGDVAAMFALHRLIGVVRAIIETPVYRTLDFMPPSIKRIFVQDINIGETANQDAASVMMGRMVLAVHVPEDVQLLTAPLLLANYTTIKLHLTDKGYKYDYIKV